MRDLLNIIPRHFDENNCYEDQIASIALWYHDYIIKDFLLPSPWDFDYMSDSLSDSEKTSDEAKRFKYQELLQECYGLHIIPHFDKSFDNFVELVKMELFHSNPVVISMLSNQIPWDPNYKNSEPGHLKHAFIIDGIDEEKRVMIATDGYYIKKNVEISFANILNGFTGHFVSFAYNGKSYNNDISKWLHLMIDFVHYLASDENPFNNIRLFASEIDSLENLERITIHTGGSFIRSNIHLEIVEAKRKRLKTAKLFKYLYDASGCNEFYRIYEQLIITSTKWTKLESMFIKAGFLKDFSSIKSRIVSEILHIADFEQCLTQQVKSIMDKPVCLQINNETACNKTKTTKIHYVDILPYFNNKGFGNSLSDLNANINSNPCVTREYFYSETQIGGYIEINKMRFKIPEIDDIHADNISCSGQEIFLNLNRCVSIMILGCSEWGDFIEELEIKCEDNRTEKINITFTEWWKKPLFNEEIALECNCVFFENNNTPKLAPSKRFLFAKTYPLKNNGFVKSIKLPNVSNIHIFAISMEQEA